MPRERHAWLARKAAHDSAAGATDALPPANTAQLWMVHGKWYDLEAFAARHPGGAFWITETRGMDITELYETHHLDMDGPDQILRKHLVRVQPCVSVACLAASPQPGHLVPLTVHQTGSRPARGRCTRAVASPMPVVSDFALAA
eukprot:COSAG01_NODE_15807_length_1297_cov_2.440735_2_plen_144_part_00